MLEIARVGNAESMRDLYSIQVDHSNEFLRNIFSERAEVCQLHSKVHVVEAFAILCKLQIKEFVFEHFVGTDDVWSLRRYIDPLINDPADLLVCWMSRTAVLLDLIGVDNLEDELLGHIWTYMPLALLDADEAFRRNDVTDLRFG